MCWANGPVSLAGRVDTGRTGPAGRVLGRVVALRIAVCVSMVLYLQELAEVLVIRGAERKIQIIHLRGSP
jgi:hypothetical protein